jgi:ribosome biogenesis ATPase
LFFDELDALVPRRDDSLSEASSRVVNTLLTELDGLGGSREGIYIIAATNRPDIIDPAMLRPGRLENLIYVTMPTANDRIDIMRALLAKTPIPQTLATCVGGEDCEGYTGADLGSLISKAGQSAIKRGADIVEEQDFIRAITQVRRSVSAKDMERYERMRKQFQSLL